MPENILHRILQTKRREVQDLRSRCPLEQMRRQAEATPKPRNFFSAVTARPRGLVNLIAEVKKASPSAGVICEDFDPVRIAEQYERAGAAALSVLTDRDYFQGDLGYIAAIKQRVNLPILRKDFIIDPYQVYQSRAAGADAILLIAAALPPGTLLDLMILATQLKLTTLVEVHGAEELMTVRSMIGFGHAAYSILGINNRDLTSFEVDLNTTLRLAELVDREIPIVSESGIRTRRDVEKLAKAGVKAILVGETLMRAGDVQAEVSDLLGL